ncbi:MAG: polysaccharide deacetylase family protein [Deltaproteobacteria bacterium]|nr:polysaccharide deacetylase family protein [Deltaproteobacteria bacterium]
MRLHLSFDDAPWAGKAGTSLPSVAVVARLNTRIVETLKSRTVPASVFFNCDVLRGDDGSVEAWVEADMEIGNHTFSHSSLNHEPMEAWLADTRRCHEVLVGRLPSPPRYFRYPYLHQGPVLETRDGARRGLEEMGYTIAPVTVTTTEWRLAFAYKDAVDVGDAAQQQVVVDAYRKHMQEAVDASRAMAREQVDREVAQIVLFHVNDLSSDHLGEVIDEYRARGATFVSLEQALADPVYAMEDHYVGSGGLSWLLRIRQGQPPDSLYWFGEEEERLRELFPDP